MGKKTPLYAEHVALSAKIVEFSGWDMPLHYGSLLNEHHAVRQNAGVFDVSHMGIVDIIGQDALSFLRHLFANDVNKITSNQALYTCMLNDSGGIMDDLIIYRIADDSFRLVINAGTREKDIIWINAHASDALSLKERTDLAMLACQGPKIDQLLESFLPPPLAKAASALKPFHFTHAGSWMIARTGYTGENGYEIILPGSEAVKLWRDILRAGVTPCGLGCRDTLRLEAGLNLYGSDMDETVTPYASNLGWTVALSDTGRDFMGRKILEALNPKSAPFLTGLVLMGPGVLRAGQKLYKDQEEVGIVTSGSFAPTLGKSIALARFTKPVENECTVMIRQKMVKAKLLKPPFVRQGKKMF